jgi:hypothetical protein
MFHFVNRLSSWTSDPEASQVLQRFTPNPSETHSILAELLTHRAEDNPTINLSELRLPYFAEYPWLYGLELALFQMRHWYIEYNVDTRAYFHNHSDFAVWDASIAKLHADMRACAILSTYAVNCIYLWYRLIHEDERVLFTSDEPDYFSNEHTLAVYFATHCCLAETIFYARPIPSNTLSLYRTLLKRAEAIATAHMDELSLDALLETVIAQQLCGMESPFRDIVIARATAQFDEKLGYITDPNKPGKNDLNGAEHRNILYLMATTAPREALLR